MARHLDLGTWSRRSIFEFFRTYDNPYFNICTTMEVGPLVEFSKQRDDVSFFLAYHYLAIRVANEEESFRYRLREDGVVVHDRIDIGTTMLVDDERFTFAYFEYSPDYGTFSANAARVVERIRSGDGALDPHDDNDAMVHCSVLPWVSFTSISHARNWRRMDSVPKMSFGKYFEQEGRVMMPISVEVHHALMDGLHAARFLTRLQEYLVEPAAALDV